MDKKRNGTVIRTEKREKDGYEYEYQLTQSEGCRVASYGIPLYSISVKMKRHDGNRISENDAQNLFSDQRKATVFFERIVENLATPIDLAYIIEDELSR